MGDEIGKKVNFLFGAIVFLCVIQVAGLAYMRKKFDDNIKILQSSETVMGTRVATIESMLSRMQKLPVAVNK